MVAVGRGPDGEGDERVGGSPSVEQSVCGRGRGSGARLADDREELLASIAGDGVAVAGAGGEEPSEIGKDLVSREMPEPVVELLEVVQVQQQQRVAGVELVQEHVDV